MELSEVAKIIASGLTPLILVVIAYFLNKRLKDIEQIQWANQRVIEKRIEFYSRTVPDLNNLLCFYTYVGNWKELKPVDIVNLKRKLDKDFNVNAPLFPEEVLEKFFLLIGQCFETFGGWGTDTKLRTHFFRRKQAIGDDWNSSWEMLFAPESAIDPIEIQNAYNALVIVLARSLGVGTSTSAMPRVRVPHGSEAGTRREPS